MFTIKFYTDGRQRIYTADSFTILRGEHGEAEITVHRKNGDDFRADVVLPGTPRQEGWPETYTRAIIENAAGKTTEIIEVRPFASYDGIPKHTPKAA